MAGFMSPPTRMSDVAMSLSPLCDLGRIGVLRVAGFTGLQALKQEMRPPKARTIAVKWQ